MELIKENIQFNLSKLNEVKPIKYSASDLHAQRGHLIRRVQRQENKRYTKLVDSQKKKLSANLVQIDSYYAALKAEEDRRAALLEDYYATSGISPASAPAFQPIESVVPKPTINLGLLPTQRFSRMHARKRLIRRR